MSKHIDSLVDRFLGWNLPKSVCSDTCVSVYGCAFPRSGTNLLTAAEARQMFEYVLQVNEGTQGLGTPVQAIQFALKLYEDGLENNCAIFLKDWNEGDISEWPDYAEKVKVEG